MTLKVKCPTCKEDFVYSTTNKYRPFCSERCRLIDLGNWAEGKYQVEVPPETQEDFDLIIETLEKKNQGR